ncbi:MAG: type II toxin-antitoxin system VapB family antitoxin [Nitrospirae bacterium]|nr:type II toxin-antitoxin system VapB family antitoxin [Nitrospirota bacterium]MDA1304289.1 type II toxin-antitoxin system VapB family antitoxin [Nitrospirota bacterium]
MRTNIVLDENLVQEAFKYAAGKTKRELVNQALQEFVDHHRRRDVREIKGTVRIRQGYDHKKLRAGTP